MIGQKRNSLSSNSFLVNAPFIKINYPDIELVMALHKYVKSLHIGCDEVYHLGECSDCSGQGRTDVFVKHVSTVANYVKNKYPHVSLNLFNP